VRDQCDELKKDKCGKIDKNVEEKKRLKRVRIC